MPDETVTQLDPMRTTYSVCHCDNEGEIENEAICSSDKTIPCDIIQTKPYQKNTCYAKRRRRSLQTRLTYIPDNFVQHIERQKASNSHKYVTCINKPEKFDVLYYIFHRS